MKNRLYYGIRNKTYYDVIHIVYDLKDDLFAKVWNNTRGQIEFVLSNYCNIICDDGIIKNETC